MAFDWFYQNLINYGQIHVTYMYPKDLNDLTNACTFTCDGLYKKKNFYILLK